MSNNLIRNIGAGVSLLSLSEYQLDINTVSGSAQLFLPSVANWLNFRKNNSGQYSGDLQSIRLSDIGGAAALNNITIYADTESGNTINGAASLVISTNLTSGLLIPNANGTSWLFVCGCSGGGGPCSGAGGGGGG